jgi:hypothetical protein
MRDWALWCVQASCDLTGHTVRGVFGMMSLQKALNVACMASNA